MNLNGKLMEFIVVHDLLPVHTRWKKSASGIGRMFNDVFHIMDRSERAKLAEMMFSWGIEDADGIVESLKIERNLHGCAIALLCIHRIFGIKSQIAEESAEILKIHATECLWIHKKGWGPEVCASIDRYEQGTVEGINSNIIHSCTKRRSVGDTFCEIVLKNRKE